MENYGNTVETISTLVPVQREMATQPEQLCSAITEIRGSTRTNQLCQFAAKSLLALSNSKEKSLTTEQRLSRALINVDQAGVVSGKIRTSERVQISS